MFRFQMFSLMNFDSYIDFCDHQQNKTQNISILEKVPLGL